MHVACPHSDDVCEKLINICDGVVLLGSWHHGSHGRLRRGMVGDHVVSDIIAASSK